MLNVANLVIDPAFAQNISLYRSSGKWDKGKFISNPPEQLTIIGSVQPAGEKDTIMTPQGNQIQAEVAVYSNSVIHTTRAGSNPGLSDEIEWSGARYRVMRVEDWHDFGYYKALCVRKAGSNE